MVGKSYQSEESEKGKKYGALEGSIQSEEEGGTPIHLSAALDPVKWAYRTHPGKHVIFDEEYNAVIITEEDPQDQIVRYRESRKALGLVLHVEPEGTESPPGVVRGGRR